MKRLSAWLGETWTVLVRAARDAREEGLTTTAQALAYSLFLAIPALFLVLFGLFSIFADESAVSRLIERARTVMPEEATALLQQSLDRATQQAGRGLVMTVVGSVLALWTTTSAATTLMKGITSTYDRDDERSFVRRRLVALAIVAALALSAVLVFALLVLGPHLERWIGSALGAPTLTAWVWWTAQWPILIVGLLFAFAAVLYLAPDVDRPRWELVTPGAVTALVVWLAGSGAFALYSGHFGSFDKTWGTLSAVIITLIWLWLSSAALLFGAEVNAQTRKLEAEQEGSAPELDSDLLGGAAAATRSPSARATPR